MDQLLFLSPFTNTKKLEFCMHRLLVIDYLTAVESLFWQLGCTLVAIAGVDMWLLWRG